MINKLKNKIFLILMISLSVIILGVIIIFTVLNYNNTINTSLSMMNRFSNTGNKPEFEKDRTITDNFNIDTSGLYFVLVKDSEIISLPESTTDENLEEYAIKLSEKNSESGIIGDYVYRVRKDREDTIEIMFMENGNAISHFKLILIFSISLGALALIIIYSISKKISKVLVEPVQETFDKQKQFISDASHELKTPLAVIEANADVLENEVGENKWLGYIQNEIDSMDKLINDLLMLTKIENVDNVKERKEFDLAKEIQIVVSMFESMAYEKNVKLINNITENIKIFGIKEDIEHVVSVLLDNAIKHTDSEKEIIVELNKNKNDIILQVKNMGEPIPEEERVKIFERFYRVDKSRNRKEKRYGLGLAIAKSIVQKYKGTINVSYKDGYTIFKVVIPN